MCIALLRATPTKKNKKKNSTLHSIDNCNFSFIFAVATDRAHTQIETIFVSRKKMAFNQTNHKTNITMHPMYYEIELGYHNLLARIEAITGQID